MYIACVQSQCGTVLSLPSSLWPSTGDHLLTVLAGLETEFNLGITFRVSTSVSAEGRDSLPMEVKLMVDFLSHFQSLIPLVGLPVLYSLSAKVSQQPICLLRTVWVARYTQ